MVPEVDRMTSDRRQSRRIFEPERVMPLVVPFPVDIQFFEHGGYQKFLTLDADQKTTHCDILPIAAVSEESLAENPKHLFIWKGKNNEVIIHRVERLGQVKPLNELAIDWQPQVGFLRAGDIINDTTSAQLIHIGPLSQTTDDDKVIRFLAQVDNFINIPVGDEGDLRFTYWHAGYNRKTAELSVFSGDTDAFMTANLSRQEENPRIPFYLQYLKYLENGGCVNLEFMRDAVKLTHTEMTEKYNTLSKFTFETPEQIVKNLLKQVGMSLEPEQFTLLINLTAIPADAHISVYLGGIFTSKTDPHQTITFVHPSDLYNTAKLGEVLKWTGDKTRHDQLNDYLKNLNEPKTTRIEPVEEWLRPYSNLDQKGLQTLRAQALKVDPKKLSRQYIFKSLK